MRINHNISAMNAQRQLGINQSGNSKALQKLSSGLKINTAADDAAGLAISERMRAQIRGLDQAQRNAQDGISLIQTAEGALQETTELVQRMRELAVQATSDIMTSSDRQAIETEMNQLKAEINRSANTLAYNGKKLFTGEMAQQEKETVNQLTKATISGAPANATVTATVGTEVEVAGEYTLSWEAEGSDSILSLTGPDGKVYKSDVKVVTSDLATTGASGLGTSGKVKFADLGVELNLSSVDGAVKADGVAGKIKLDTTPIERAIEVEPYEINAEKLEEDIPKTVITVDENASVVGELTVGFAQEGANYVLTLSDGTNTYYGKSDSDTPLTDITTSDLSALGTVSFEELDIEINVSEVDAASKAVDISGKKFNVVKNPSSARIHVGANADDEGIDLTIADMTTGPKGLDMTETSISVSTATNAKNTLKKLDEVLTKINTERANLGAMQNRIESTVNNLALSSENLTSAESRIRDVDMAAQMVEYSKYNILNQAAMSMLAQANSQPNMVMNLLQGL